jgi:antiviral helicase SLH1
MISLSGEFDNIQIRDSDASELARLKDEACPCQIPTKKKTEAPKVKETGPADKHGKKGGNKDEKTFASHRKVNILLQAYISRANIEDFALVSDCNYVAQNAGRICRALFQIALNRRWGHLCEVLLSLSKSIEKK